MNRRTSGPRPAGARVLLEPGMLDNLRLSWRLLRDPRVGTLPKVAIPLLTGVYVLSPIDLIPDLFLGLGQLDDLGVIGLALLMLVRVLPRLAPQEVVAEHLATMGFAGAPTAPEQGSTGPVLDADYRVRD